MAKRINKQIPLVILIVFFSNIAWSGEYLKGDADGNGKINIFDALIIAEYTVELITEEQIPGIEFADVDGNGKVDIRDALRIAKFDHTGGLANFTANPIWLEDILIHKEVKMTPQELVDLVAAEPLFSPGETWEYNNTGYILMGMIIEKVTGNKWEDEIRDRFIEPLGLTHTDIPETGELGIPGEFVHGYIDLYAKSDGQFGTPGVIIDNTEMEPSLLWSAGVIVSNFNDMAQWMKAVGEGQLLNETYQNILETEYIIIDQNSGFGWGLGFMKIGILDIIGHTGQLLGYDTSMNYQMSSGYSIAAGINRELCSDEPYTDVNYMILYDVMAFLNGLAAIPAQSNF
ncbi:MAG: serine hydrolase [Desulfobacteraceae bacterium]|nr:serine hydrolase [Desulfobacteraceae bacterium]